MKRLYLTILMLLVPTMLLAQENKQIPCSAEEFAQFDFWVGEWDLTWGDTLHGTNKISKPLDKCVVMENFDSHPSGQFRGISVSTYDIKAKKWKQTWVDNNGAYLDFVGGMVADSMVLSREAKDKDGNMFMQRMVWYNITDKSFTWDWQKSTDQGKSWETSWQILYQRK